MTMQMAAMHIGRDMLDELLPHRRAQILAICDPCGTTSRETHKCYLDKWMRGFRLWMKCALTDDGPKSCRSVGTNRP